MYSQPTDIVFLPPTPTAPSAATTTKTFITAKGSIYEGETGWYTAYSTTGESFSDRQSAIDHGDERYRSNDFNICTLVGDEVVAIGFRDTDFAPGFEDLTALSEQLAGQIA